MVTFNELRLRLTEARKARDEFTVGILSTLIGELSANAKMVDGQKTVTEEEVTQHLKKHVKKLEETIGIKIERGASPTDIDEELEKRFVEQFLPSQMAEDQILAALTASQAKSIGEFMAFMKKNHAGQYDGRLASDLFKKHA